LYSLEQLLDLVEHILHIQFALLEVLLQLLLIPFDYVEVLHEALVHALTQQVFVVGAEVVVAVEVHVVLLERGVLPPWMEVLLLRQVLQLVVVQEVHERVPHHHMHALSIHPIYIY
jgi:hypothetical protein